MRHLPHALLRAFSRWLFMRTHRYELVTLARMARGTEALPDPSCHPPTMDNGRRVGIIDALEVADLLVR